MGLRVGCEVTRGDQGEMSMRIGVKEMARICEMRVFGLFYLQCVGIVYELYTPGFLCVYLRGWDTGLCFSVHMRWSGVR